MKDAAIDIAEGLQASEFVRGLLRSTAMSLGANAELAEQAASTGLLELESRTVYVVVAPDESSLILSTPLNKDWACEAERRDQALAATLHLMLNSGVAFGITPAGPALICRWPLAQADARLLAMWVQEFSFMANFTEAGAAAPV